MRSCGKRVTIRDQDFFTLILLFEHHGIMPAKAA